MIKVNNNIIVRNGIEGLELNAKFEHDQFCYNMDEEVKIFNLVKRLVDSTPFKVFLDNGAIPHAKQNNEYAKFHLNYFEKLKAIERYFEVRFTKFDFAEINNGNIWKVNTLFDITQGREFQKLPDPKYQVLLEPGNEEIYKIENLRKYL